MKLTDSFIGGVILLLLVGHFALTTTAQAEAGQGREKQRQSVSSDQAASAVRSATGGKVLGVRGGKRGGGSYSVRVLLPDGRVRTLSVDAQTGRVSD
ncbi:MAG: hypothetical protein R3F37_21320 [Candidatus Competibacteraceae bacterium]